MKDLNWWTVLEAHYGVSITPEMKDVWEHYIKQHGVKNDELCRIIETASSMSLQPRGYKATVADLVNWIVFSRQGWVTHKVRPLQAVKS